MSDCNMQASTSFAETNIKIQETETLTATDFLLSKLNKDSSEEESSKFTFLLSDTNDDSEVLFWIHI